MRRPFAGGGGVQGRGAPVASSVADEATHWRRRAEKFRAAGDHKRAAEACRRYLDAPISDPQLRAAAADAIAGRLALAAGKLQQFLTVNRGDPVASRMLGQIAFQMGSLKEAEQIFRTLTGLVPGHPSLRYELASALLLQGQVEEALIEADALLRRDPQNYAYLNLRAAGLHKLGDIDGAIALYERLLVRHSGTPKLWIDYGNALRAKRRSEDAIAAFRRGVSLKPEYGEAWWNLSNMKVGALDAEDLPRMRAALTSSNASPSDQTHLRFAIARLLEEQGAFKDAFDEYKEANRTRLAAAGQLKGPSTSQRVARTIALFTPEFMEARAGAGDPAPDPIFIVGMPRSGSTLLEQILSAHPLVEGTQELPDLVRIAQTLDMAGGEAAPHAYPQAIANVSRDALRELGANYLSSTRTKRRTDRPFFVDKQPANWLHVGLIRLILPNAKIIDMRRSALANALSLFRQHFPRGVMYSYSIDALAEEMRAYHRLMEFFADSPTAGVTRIDLEQLLENLEGSVRKLLDELGLPFAPDCLRFFDSDRAVFTPSSEQVRRPINRDGQKLFESFEPYLDDLRLGLNNVTDT